MSVSMTHGPVRVPKRAQTPAETPAPAVVQPHQWLVVQGTAVLESVATANYACYGRGGVPHYPAPKPTPDPTATVTLCTEVIVRGADGAVRFALLDLTLTCRERSDQRVTWVGYDEARHIQVIWVWDFYRILSHVALRAAIPPEGAAPNATWREALADMRTVAAGDAIVFSVRSVCGNIEQTHAIARPASLWEPEK